MEILERMEKNQREFFAKMEAKLSLVPINPAEWIDSLGVQKILGITRKTVYRLTANGTLTAKSIGRRKYYSRTSIFKLRDEFLK